MQLMQVSEKQALSVRSPAGGAKAGEKCELRHEKGAISHSARISRANQGSPRTPLGQNFGPTHASLRSPTAIMITSSDSSVKRSRMPNQFLGMYCAKLTSFPLS